MENVVEIGEEEEENDNELVEVEVISPDGEDASDGGGEQTEKDSEELVHKNTESFKCLAQVLMSRSSLLNHPLYHFPPLSDPGIDAALNYFGEMYLRKLVDEGFSQRISLLTDIAYTTANTYIFLKTN